MQKSIADVGLQHAARLRMLRLLFPRCDMFALEKRVHPTSFFLARLSLDRVYQIFDIIYRIDNALLGFENGRQDIHILETN